MAEPRYFIRWQSKRTGATGGGTLALPQQQAEEELARLEAEWGADIRHWLEKEAYHD